MIEINNLTTGRVDTLFLKRIAKKVLEGGKPAIRQLAERKKNLDLSIALVNPARIKELNKKYRRKDKVTDVLSFGENTRYQIPNTKDKIQNLGEIVICPQVIKANAKKFDSTFKKEFAQVLIHGILHLLGYDHEKGKKDARIMEERQNFYLKKLVKL
jgi:probable rRNA maturation factor